LYGIKPDITTFAKIMGGGLPCGAYGGRKEVMEYLSPVGPVYQAGTMSGNPIVMAAGYAALTKLYNNPELYKRIDMLGEKLQRGVEEAAKEKQLPIVVNRCGSMMTIFFTKRGRVTNYEEAKECDTSMYAAFFEHMLKNGIYMAPSQFEALFISTKHTEADIDRFIEAVRSF
jgi:glutamate-1-semialdehyde 2,1-aminomutase